MPPHPEARRGVRNLHDGQEKPRVQPRNDAVNGVHQRRRRAPVRQGGRMGRKVLAGDRPTLSATVVALSQSSNAFSAVSTGV